MEDDQLKQQREEEEKKRQKMSKIAMLKCKRNLYICIQNISNVLINFS
jgi:hypothetical protein